MSHVVTDLFNRGADSTLCSSGWKHCLILYETNIAEKCVSSIFRVQAICPIIQNHLQLQSGYICLI